MAPFTFRGTGIEAGGGENVLPHAVSHSGRRRPPRSRQRGEGEESSLMMGDYFTSFLMKICSRLH